MDFTSLELSARMVAIALTAVLTAKMIAWVISLRRDLQADQHRSPHPPQNNSAEWRGETGEVLRGIREVLKEHVERDLRAPLESQEEMNHKILAALQEVQEALVTLAEDAAERRRIAEEVHTMMSKWL